MSHAMPEADDYNITFYLPCHFDYSQVETVTPFLERWGGRVFLYKWHTDPDRIRDYFAQFGSRVSVEWFSPESWVRALQQDHPKRAVVLLTASLSTEFNFGRFQLKSLQALQQLSAGRIADVSAVGHCMYGCYSCTSSQHKIPLYFTRFFKHTLPYSTQDVRKRWLDSTASCVHVLCAPSMAETSQLQWPRLTNSMLRLQQRGTHKFIFKLHPTCYNEKNYDLTWEVDRQELETLRFVRANFEVVPPDFHCVLPFLEAADVVICDLQSTVPFATCYFAPKVLLAFQEPGDPRTYDKEYLDSMHLFSNDPERLEDLLIRSRSLEARGNRSFFTKIYGQVDGQEDLRYAALSNWPRLSSGESAAPTALSDAEAARMLEGLRGVWRGLTAEVAAEDQLEMIQVHGGSGDESTFAEVARELYGEQMDAAALRKASRQSGSS